MRWIPPERSLDRITRIVANALDVPMAAVSLIDGHRVWHKSRQGPLELECPRSASFCTLAIRQPKSFVVTDAATDERVKENPHVVGPPHVRAYAGAQLRTASGHNLGMLCAVDTKPRAFEANHIAILEDLAAMVMSELEAYKLARIDSLTGALTRGAFRDEAERAIALASRHRHALSCMVFDLDHFKSINDTHGHAAGDCVLIEAVKVSRARLRKSDILGRIGGEEFAVVLPHTNAADALHVAEGVRDAVANGTPDTDIKVTATFGIASFELSPIPLDELLRRADIALYEAKEAGRNACAVWRNPVDPTIMRRVLKAGQIVFNAGRSTIDCTVRGLSQSGASLEIASTAAVPEAFKLTIGSDGLSRACNMTGKHGRKIEVLFA